MIPIEFPEQTCVFAKDQPEYLPLPAFVEDSERRAVVSKWQLTTEELTEINSNGGVMYLTTLTFRNALQPLLPEVFSPFIAGNNPDGHSDNVTKYPTGYEL